MAGPELRHRAAALLVATGILRSAAADTLKLVECELPGHAGPARCGELTVPENPDRPDGRQLEIAIAVLPATGGKALPDPVVPLMGGPGEDAIIAAKYFAERLAPLRKDRDILFVDQRGTGKSNVLRCDLHDPAAPGANLRDLIPLAATQRCARELGERADLTQYTYLHFSRDLEQVRRALGYGKLNLFAGSYGTRAAQVFVRAYPESVRTVFLGSVVPIDEVTPLTMAKASQAVFERTFDACAADATCRGAFPDVREEFAEILKRLDAGAVRVSAPGATDAPLSRGRVVEWMRSQLYRPSTAAAIPWLIHQAHAGNWSPIADGILAQARGFDEVYGAGLFFSITCAEDMAFLREDEIAPASQNTFLGDYRLRQQEAACRDWPKASLPAGYRDPVRSPVPTMLLSGDMDAAGPLWLTERAAKGFSNRVEIVARGQGHTEWNDCVGRLYRQFVETGKADGIDPTGCPAIPRPPFKTADDEKTAEAPAAQPEDPFAPGREIVASIQRIVTPDGIQQSFVATLGGARQAVSVRGADHSKPLLLFVHGGPGAVEMPIAWAFQRSWEDFFTVVQWDQRGAGKSFAMNDPKVIARQRASGA